MQTITCLVNDSYPGTPNPLLYTVKVKDPENHAEVMAAVRAARLYDLDGVLAEDLELTLLLAFAGDVFPRCDWRDF